MQKSTDITWHDHTVTKAARVRKNGYKPCVIWFTGLSASGKSTLANALAARLFANDYQVYVLDGDNVRHGLNKNLGFSHEERSENIRRVGEVANLFIDAGMIVLTAFISPYIADRDKARQLVGEGEFIEVFVKCAVEECQNRDPKGLYAKAVKGEIPNFTGISAPYEEPPEPEFVIDTEKYSLDECVKQLMDYVTEHVAESS